MNRTRFAPSVAPAALLATLCLTLSACDRLSSRPAAPRAAAASAPVPRMVEGAPLPAVTAEGVTLPGEDSRRLAPPTSAAPGAAAPELSADALQKAREQVAREMASRQQAKPHADLPVPRGAHKGVVGNTDKPVSPP